MPRGVIRRLITTYLLFSCGSAQSCYFPNGSQSNHTSCAANGVTSACCASNAYCLNNGLCLEAGVVTRASCTDKSWKSDACPSYCANDQAGGSLALTPCSLQNNQSTFACGLNTTSCRDKSKVFSLPASSALVLRPAQVSALVDPILASVASQASSSQSQASKPTETSYASGASPVPSYYTLGQVVGIALGLGIPLLIATCTAFTLWRKERARHPRLMYQLPDELNMDLKPMPPTVFPTHPAVRSLPASCDGYPGSRDGYPQSRNGLPGAKDDFGYAPSYRTVTPVSAVTPVSPVNGRETPQHMQTFAERYQAMNKQMPPPRAAARALSRYELDGQPVGSAFRFNAYERPSEDEIRPSATTTIEPGRGTIATPPVPKLLLPRERPR